MQPESNQAIQDPVNKDPSPKSQSLAQHGNPLPPAHSPGRASDQDDTGEVPAETGPHDCAVRIESPSYAKTVATDRVSEYEHASIVLPSNRGALPFKAIAFRATCGGHQSSILESLPNEVLTHILSHLPPAALSSMCLVNRRFHGLVTTPHAWRTAFSRYFPGPAAIDTGRGALDPDELEHLSSRRRAFCRLTALASWRNEYILRTRLLRSLGRGKPADNEKPGPHASPRGNHTASQAISNYNSLLLYPVSNIDGAFGSGLEKKAALFVHGASEQGTASASEPAIGKSGLGAWGISDPQTFNHFEDSFPGEQQWGLGSGEIVGLPNVMDVSQQYGMVYGEGRPHGRIYFLSSNEKRGRFLNLAESPAQPHLGMPKLIATNTSICSVWIAKSAQILSITKGVCGILMGGSNGVLTAYAIGPHHSYSQRYERGEITARWILSPGVPITSISVDENFSTKRHASRRIWAVVLNALGEVFYLTQIPVHEMAPPKSTMEHLHQSAWETGRSVRWELVEETRRVTQPDPFNTSSLDGNYSPRSSSHSSGLAQAQLTVEAAEIEKYLDKNPHHFRKVYKGWDMRRKLEVDFAGDDYQGAGESVTLVTCGVTPGQRTCLTRFTRLNNSVPPDNEPFSQAQSNTAMASIFGSSGSVSTASATRPFALGDYKCLQTSWTKSNLVIDLPKAASITVTAMDMSTIAVLTTLEDPLLGMCGGSESSLMSTPRSDSSEASLPAQVPGNRGRFFAIGTSTGTVIVWNIRAPVSQNSEVVNHIDPVRVIRTDSPQVTSLALTSLYLVHGGNDGLVQAWDPLASCLQPIRTLNSRFSSRARRRLQQAEASVPGVGHNFFAAGAICLDPDPTRLRGIVSLGTQLRYWWYSSSAADHYKSTKRRLRYSERKSNRSTETDRYSHTGRGALKDYIFNEQLEIQRLKQEQEKAQKLLNGRFGVDILGPGASEDDLLAYACMLSEESYTSDERKRRESESSAGASSSGGTVAPQAFLLEREEPSYKSHLPDQPLDPSIAEAIRRSLNDETLTFEREFDCVITRPRPAEESSSLYKSNIPTNEHTAHQEVEDFKLALRLSLAEDENNFCTESESQGCGSFSEDSLHDFPSLDNTTSTALSNRNERKGRGKGKGKGRA
ncbi:hypothetical protein LOZ57_002419 [Ophidiomyces ophidiicola]|uniref:uncharacterized protein n=1 Tax=Ophidiomyces ophidiicola TaxID=1387563 RepID=UPI0020C2560A|nr:uncharacterized protein LOZ57_002419 [Ophidiomyces ophidiicola]KAI1949054.1 hypothetical protein LOZ57_002419 [Ophidiomyces ophidiicola]KAI2047890.1 hypothetical protein LOZ43_005530 [Ophidiomyces ophidiicola]